MELSFIKPKITNWLSRTNNFWFSLYTAGTAFCLYTCIYAFRKTFSVATFDGHTFLGIDYKVWLVSAQVLGYALSKFIGIKIISELKTKTRSVGILITTAIAWLAWLFFALLPPPYNIVFLFINGIPLGMVWGMIFSYLEGRRCTELLGAGLSVSFIFSSGFVKSAGGIIMRDWGASEYWMPFVTSCLFVIPLVLFLWLLDRVPAPSALDETLRTKRNPMNKEERGKFITTFLPGILLFVLAYVLLTAFRDFRDNFSAEFWATSSFGNSPEIFTLTEIPISIAVLAVMASIMLIRNNAAALMINHIIVISGMLLIGIATWLFENHQLSAVQWMISIGLGLYLGYVPFNSIFFDRLIAAFKYAGTVGFIMYVADSFGYLGSVGVLFFKEFGFKDVSWMSFFISGSYVVAIAGTLLITGSLLYFQNKLRRWDLSEEVSIKEEPATLAV